MNPRVKIVKALLILAALPLLAGAATRRYIVELNTEPAARFAGRSFGARNAAMARPEVQRHMDAIHTEQESVASEVRKLGGRILDRTDCRSGPRVVTMRDRKRDGSICPGGSAR